MKLEALEFQSTNNQVINPKKIFVSISFQYDNFRINFTLHLIKHGTKKTYEEVEVHLHAISHSSLDVDEWPVSRAGRFTPQGEAFAIHILDD